MGPGPRASDPKSGGSTSVDPVDFMPYLSCFGFSADVLDNYNKSPFLASETNNFSDSAGGDHTGDYRTILLFLPSFTLSL
jgi:hypothetical protein